MFVWIWYKLNTVHGLFLIWTIRFDRNTNHGSEPVIDCISFVCGQIYEQNSNIQSNYCILVLSTLRNKWTLNPRQVIIVSTKQIELKKKHSLESILPQKWFYYKNRNSNRNKSHIILLKIEPGCLTKKHHPLMEIKLKTLHG